ncbi:MAG TPA: WG repeat-containing protein, partial [Clostridia bacterium]|nr:WG repeat-containing protein [Clostridia bacterium]
AKFNTASCLDSDFTFGNAIVIKDGKYGIIDTKGRYIVKPGYSLITKDPSNKLYITRLGSKYGVLDSKGRVIFKPIYSDIRVSNSIICAYKNSSARLYDSGGNAITKKSYNILTVNNAVLPGSCTVFTFINHGKYGALIVREK